MAIKTDFREVLKSIGGFTKELRQAKARAARKMGRKVKDTIKAKIRAKFPDIDPGVLRRVANATSRAGDLVMLGRTPFPAFEFGATIRAKGKKLRLPFPGKANTKTRRELARQPGFVITNAKGNGIVMTKEPSGQLVPVAVLTDMVEIKETPIFRPALAAAIPEYIDMIEEELANGR